MRIKCFFNKHKWEYGSESIILLTIGTIAPYTMNVTNDVDTRYCPICNKKERKTIGGEFWVEHPLNKEELRDRKLKQLIG